MNQIRVHILSPESMIISQHTVKSFGKEMQGNFVEYALTVRLIGGKLRRRGICFPHQNGITLLRGAKFPVSFAIAHQFIPRRALSLAPSVTYHTNYM